MGRQGSELRTTLEIKLCASDGGGRGASANVIWTETTETGECSRVKVGGCGLDDIGVTAEVYGNWRRKRPRRKECFTRKPAKPISSEFNKFFVEDAKTTLARKGAQITFLDNRARFYHKSIMEYYSARYLYDALKRFKDRESNCLALLSLKSLYGKEQTDQESDVLNFLVEMIHDNDNQ